MKSFLNCLLAVFVFLVPSFGVAQSPIDFSGSWYNPARDGEGFHIQLLDTGQALVIWFTYPGATDNAQTEQSWILGIGDFDGSKITINDAIRANGPVFGEGYDKDDFNRIVWGELNVTFSGVDNGVVEYDGLDGAGSTQVKRVTSIVAEEVQSSLPAGVSGAWYDPETDGQGWFVEILSPSSALVYWFTYDQNGNQAWNLGIGEIFEKEIILPESLAGKGTRFGDDFMAGDVVRVPFGMLKLRFENCTSGSMDYLLTDGADEGSFPLTRLTSLDSKTCVSIPGPTEDQSVMTNASDPLATQYVGRDNIQMNLFGKKDISGRLGRLSSGNVLTPAGHTVLFDLDPVEPVVLMQDTDSGITLTTELDPSGNIQVVLNDPENGVSAALGAEATDTSTALAAKSRNAYLQAVEPGLPQPQAGEAGTALVPVSLCGLPATAAQVNFVVGANTANAVTIPALEISPGQYQADIPTGLSPASPDTVLNDVCRTTTQQFGQICDVITSASDVCNPLGVQVAEINPSAAVNAAAVCSAAIASFRSACAANDLRTADCGPSPSKVFRDFSAVEISVDARVPGLLATASSASLLYENPQEQLVFPAIDVPGQPYYLSHSVSPSLPQAGDAYRIDFSVGCVSAGQQLTVTNQSTGESKTCSVDTNGRCEVELASNNSDETNIVDVSGPGGFRHRLVQALEVASSGGSDGIWRGSYVDDGDTVYYAFSINHPAAFLCAWDSFETDWADLDWNPDVDHYVWEEVDGVDIFGVNMDSNESMCFFFSLDGEAGSNCIPASAQSTWAEATQGGGGACPKPSWLD